jgi:hypothetical protein
MIGSGASIPCEERGSDGGNCQDTHVGRGIRKAEVRPKVPGYLPRPENKGGYVHDHDVGLIWGMVAVIHSTKTGEQTF